MFVEDEDVAVPVPVVLPLALDPEPVVEPVEVDESWRWARACAGGWATLGPVRTATARVAREDDHARTRATS